jgi:hypothetical protein
VATYNAPVVPVFPAGYGPQASDFNTWWYETASFFQNGVVFRASQTTTATSLPSSGATTVIGYDNIIEDPYSGWNSGTHSWGPPAGYSGWYQVTMTIRTVTLANLVSIQAHIKGTWTYNLTLAQGNSTASAGVSAAFGVYLIGGQDTVQAAGSIGNSGVNVNTDLTAGQNSTLEITFLSQS